MDAPEIDVAELARRRRGPGIRLIDVRQPDEYEAGHVPGALLIPLPELPDRVAEVPHEGPVHLICGGGGRSRKGAELLLAHGVDAVNVAGGTRAWVEAGHDVVSGGEPG